MYTFTGKYTISHIYRNRQRVRQCARAVYALYSTPETTECVQCFSSQTADLSSITYFFVSLSLPSSSSLRPPADVWNVYSHMECVCKSHGNQISLIPEGLNKVAFVCAYASVRVLSPCIHSVSRVPSCVL